MECKLEHMYTTCMKYYLKFIFKLHEQNPELLSFQMITLHYIT